MIEPYFPLICTVPEIRLTSVALEDVSVYAFEGESMHMTLEEIPLAVANRFARGEGSIQVYNPRGKITRRVKTLVQDGVFWYQTLNIAPAESRSYWRREDQSMAILNFMRAGLGELEEILEAGTRAVPTQLNLFSGGFFHEGLKSVLSIPQTSFFIGINEEECAHGTQRHAKLILVGINDLLNYIETLGRMPYEGKPSDLGKIGLQSIVAGSIIYAPIN